MPTDEDSYFEGLGEGRRPDADAGAGSPPPRVTPVPPVPMPPPLPTQPSGMDHVQAWQRFRPVLWLIGLLIFSSLAGGIAYLITEDESPRLDAWITGFDAIVIMAFAWREWSAVRAALTLSVTPRAWVLAVLSFGALYVFMQGYVYLLSMAFDWIEYLASYRDYGWPKWSAVLLIVVAPALFEEIAFRGFLLERLAPLIGQRDALLLQAALFSILHLAIPSLPSHFLMGLLFGFLRIRTKSLVPGMLVHGAWNLTVLLEEGLLEAW
ncbi:MAG: lysostaphin resistance A-like protein [Planctomycetota bacterium]